MPTTITQVDLTYVVPVLNEASNIEAVVAAIELAFIGSALTTYEVLFVDDGSSDDTVLIIKRLSEINEAIKCISLSRNYGHQAALSAGLAYSRGLYVAVLDGDLQDPPEVINMFLRYSMSGYDIVYGIRRKRKESWPKRASYFLYYRLLATLSNLEIPLDSGDFCVMSRQAVNVLNQLPEKSRFVRGLRTYIGFPQIGVEYERSSRAAGTPKYSLKKLLKLASDGIFNFSDRPLKFATSFGGFIALASVVAGILFFCQRIFDISIFGYSPRQVPGYTSIIVILTLLSGIQLYTLGIIGEYISRIFIEAKARPLYIVKDVIGLEPREHTVKPAASHE